MYPFLALLGNNSDLSVFNLILLDSNAPQHKSQYQEIFYIGYHKL